MNNLDNNKDNSQNTNLNKNRNDSELNNLENLGQVNIAEFESNIFTLPIIGEIEGHAELAAGRKSTKYEHVIPQLLAVEQNPKYDGLLLIINTVGGDVEAGLALSEIISSMKKPSVSLVIGGGHSIGVPLSVSTNYSFIAPTASMTLHPIRTSGLVIAVSQSFEYFQKMQERILNFVEKNSQLKKDEFLKLMLNTNELANDMGSILIGKSAVDVGLIDEVGGLCEALAKINSLIEKNNNENK
ncbi:translocation-enhancing protein TepA [Alkalibaculum sp. M08DMB]|uniref:Translocation-enhancing protein TepA n=1 Tax=Alkalibaculum sporogenes TaxID=2655001 RepID=A0A6A7K9U1_9FIRM|nr:ATP-dependent Clp protease proteolytic subunit [Alkalibaculum sporogenes]MPW25823.1 translocation-enhancing protein TepA [Alkalibaculum sporogenes]